MNFLLKTKPKKVLIQQPDAETVAYLQRHILNVSPDAEIFAPANAQEIEKYYTIVTDIDLVIAEIYIEGIDALTDYLNFRAKHPKVPILIATRYDLSSYSEYIQGVPVVVLPYEEQHLESILPQLLEGMKPSELTSSISRKIPIGTQTIKLVQKNKNTQKATSLSKVSPVSSKMKSGPLKSGPLSQKSNLKSVEDVRKEIEQKNKKISLIMLGITLTSLAIFCWLVSLGKIPAIYRYARFLELPWTDYRVMIHIPAGEFVYGANEEPSAEATLKTEKTGEFWIDQYEVTLGQYNQFLKAVESQGPDAFAHPDMPDKSRGFKPKEWDRLMHTIRENITYNGVKLNLNCPVFNVTWWDAYAYAKWAGKRLPTEQEWEKAGRGLKGNKFSWGNDEKAVENANLGLDYSPGDPGKGGFKDGFHMMNPVTEKPLDVSEFGVFGMNGNVSEWTSTWAEGKLENMLIPVIRGGSFVAHKNIYITLRIIKRDANTPEEWLGFRCASDKPPL